MKNCLSARKPSGMLAVSLLLATSTTWAASPASTPASMPAQFAVGPDANLDLLVQTIASATKTLTINIYQFDSAEVANAVLGRINAGVKLQMILETQPCCTRKLTEDGKAVLQRIHTAMKAHSRVASALYLMGDNVHAAVPTDPDVVKAKRRYAYDHAKYVVVDGAKALVTSDNFSETGHAVPGKVGNRGWDVVLNDAGTAKDLLDIFAEDSDAKNDDILVVKAKDALPKWLLPKPFTSSNLTAASRSQAAFPAASGRVSGVDLVTSPNSLKGIVDFISGASRSAELQFMSLPYQWAQTGGPKITNPILAEMIQVATAGGSVRLLLNDDSVFDPTVSDDASAKPKANAMTVAYVNKLARCRKLDLHARIIDVKAVGITYIHNKGILTDDDGVFVSSINGTANSVMKNRETAVALRSRDAHAYFSSVFDSDWRTSTQANSDRITRSADAEFPDCPTLPGQLTDAQPFARPDARLF